MKTFPIVYVTDRFDADAMTALKNAKTLDVRTTKDFRPNEEELLQAEALIIRSRTKIDAAVLAKAPRLKMIVTCTSGFDHIDLVATEARGLSVMYTPDANAAAAAELTWALVLAWTRKVPQAVRAIKDGDWKRETLLGRNLSGKTYGVIGLGRIGKRVVRIAQSFGMRTLAFDPYLDEEDFETHGCERVSLDELFKISEVVSIHVPATEETHHMVRRNLLSEASRDLLVVNTSRGNVIPESDLIEALDEGFIAGAALDVFEKEPLSRTSGLVGRPNVVLSPHIGATTVEAFRAASMEAAEKTIAFFASATVTDKLPSDALWAKGGFGKSL